jgi:hypothetical protein
MEKFSLQEYKKVTTNENSKTSSDGEIPAARMQEGDD